MRCFRPATSWLATIALFSLAATACGSDSNGAAVLESDGSAAETPAGSDPSSELLDFTAEALDGSTVDIADFVGRDLVIWFWEPH